MNLLFDIGGTKTRLAYSDNHNKLDKIYLFDTQQTFTDQIKLFKQVFDQTHSGQTIAQAAGGIAGVLNKAKDQLLNAPNLVNWINQPLGQALSDIVSVPVKLENDASLGGLGEATYGSGQGYKIVGYLTIGTGVGGARIVNGQIDQNALGFEPGHQTIDIHGPLCHRCQTPGHLESYVSGTAIKQLYHQAAEDLTDSKIWSEISQKLAVGLNNLAVYWSPEVIVLGGSVSQSLPLNKVEQDFKASCRIFPDLPNIKQAYLGEASGLYGALALLASST